MLSIAQNQAVIDKSNTLKQNPFTVTDPWQRIVIDIWSIGEHRKHFEEYFIKVKQEGYDEELVLWFYKELEENYYDFLNNKI